MDDATEATFSIFVTAFDANAEALEAASALFKVDLEKTTALLGALPLRVKKGARAKDAGVLAKKLLAIGAELSIRNDQTGAEKVYAAARGPERSSYAPSILGPIPTAEDPNHGYVAPRLSLEPPLPPAPDEGQAASASPPGQPEEASLAATRDALSTGEPAPVEGSPREGVGADDAGALPPEADAAGAAAVGAFSSLIPPAGSLPPPSPPSQALHGPIVKCEACSHFVEKNARCAHCGWDGITKKRFCAGCGGDSFAPANGLSRWTLAAFVVGGLVAGATGGWFRGVLVGVAGVALAAAGAVVLDASRLEARCGKCKRAVQGSLLRPIERQPLVAARLKLFGLGGSLALMSVGFAALGAAGRQTDLYIDGFYFGYRASLPYTHTAVTNAELSVPTSSGPARVRTQLATSRRSPIHTYALQEIIIPGPGKTDRERIARLVGKAVSEVAKDAKLTNLEPKDLDRIPGVQASFTGTYEGAPVYGGVRGFRQTDHEIALAFFLAGSEEAAKGRRGEAFLDSFVAEVHAVDW